MTRRVRVLAATAAAILVGGIAAAVLVGDSEPDDSPEAPSESPILLTCKERFPSSVSRKALRRESVFIGPLAIYPAGLYPRLGRADLPGRGSTWPGAIPMTAVVQGDRAVTLTIDQPEGRDAAFLFRGPREVIDPKRPFRLSDGVDAATLPSCRRRPTEYHARLIVAKSGCLPVSVQVEGAAESLHRSLAIAVKGCALDDRG